MGPGREGGDWRRRGKAGRKERKGKSTTIGVEWTDRGSNGQTGGGLRGSGTGGKGGR